MNEEVGPFTLFLVTLGADLINALQREGRLGLSHVGMAEHKRFENEVKIRKAIEKTPPKYASPRLALYGLAKQVSGVQDLI